MSNSISGNAGTPGATVVIIGFSTGTGTTATADGSGNYTFSGLAADTYYIEPSLSGFTFSPYVSKQVLVSSNITGVNFTATAFTPGTAWTKQGDLQLVPPITTNGAFLAGCQGQVIYEGNAQILSGNVFKYWFMDGTSIYYAESSDGLSWTRHSGAIIANASWPTVFKNGSTYYLFCTGAVAPIKVYTSSDGINFTLQNATVLSVGGVGTWDHANLFQLYVADIIAGTWYGLYTGLANLGPLFGLGIGLATSPDGINWTKSAGNPVLLNASAPTVYKVGGIYYCYFGGVTLHSSVGGAAFQYTFPTDIYRIQSTDLINWTNLIPALPRTLLGEGANTVNSQTAYQSLVEKDGNTYMFYMGTNSGTGTGGLNATNFLTLLATAPMGIAALVQTNEGVSTSPQLAIDSFNRANENPLSDGGNWATIPISGFGALQLVSNLVEPINVATWGLNAFTGIVWPNDQYCEAVLKTKDGNGFIVLFARASAGSSGANGYVLQFNAFGGPLGGSQTINVYQITNGAVGATLAAFTATPLSGDIWRIQAKGNQISVYQNGVLVAGPFTDSTYSSGSPAIQLYNGAAITGTQLSGWAGGSATTELLPCAAPVFSPAGGTYNSTQSVIITCATPSSTITYTTDGTTPIPGSHGTVYSGPISVPVTTTIKAVGSATGFSNSGEVDATYTINKALKGTGFGFKFTFGY